MIRSLMIWLSRSIRTLYIRKPVLSTLFCHSECSIQSNVLDLYFRASCLDVYNKYGDTPLILAIKEQKGDVVEALVNSGADPSHPGRPLRKTPLMVACFGGYKAAADSLVRRGVDWNMVDRSVNSEYSNLYIYIWPHEG